MLDQVREDAQEAHRQECLKRFLRAVDEAIGGNFGPAKRLIEDVREQFGDDAARGQRKELIKTIAARRGTLTQ